VERSKFFDRTKSKFSDTSSGSRSSSPLLMQIVFVSKCRPRKALRRAARAWPIPCSLCTPPPSNLGWWLGEGKENA
jgi:hypothetical protein